VAFSIRFVYVILRTDNLWYSWKSVHCKPCFI